MNLLTTIAAFSFALGVLIVVHELGHYFVARWCGVKVLRFSLGFGRPLLCLKRGRDNTEWVLATFPLGGYVKMLDEREGEVAPADLPRAFNRQSVTRRILIVLAGPVANFLLAILLYWVVFVSGIPGLRPVIGGVLPESAAAQAQLATGDVIVKVGSQAVSTWQDARWHLLQYAVDRKPVSLEVHNERGEIHWRSLDLSVLNAESLDGDFLRALGFARLQPPLPPVIGRLIAGGAGERAGGGGGYDSTSAGSTTTVSDDASGSCACSAGSRADWMDSAEATAAPSAESATSTANATSTALAAARRRRPDGAEAAERESRCTAEALWPV